MSKMKKRAVYLVAMVCAGTIFLGGCGSAITLECDKCGKETSEIYENPWSLFDVYLCKECAIEEIGASTYKQYKVDRDALRVMKEQLEEQERKSRERYGLHEDDHESEENNDARVSGETIEEKLENFISDIDDALGGKEHEVYCNVPGNFNNWGTVCVIDDQTYFTDINTGFYWYSPTNQEFELELEGEYMDLASLGDSIIATKIVCDDDYNCSYNLVRISPKTFEEEQIESFESIEGKNVVDDKYYFVDENGALYYLTEDGELSKTAFRDVLGVTEDGVFVSARDDRGLEYLTDNGDDVVSYSQFDGCGCVVLPIDKTTALIKTYGSSDDVDKLYELNLQTKEMSLIVTGEDLGLSGTRGDLFIANYNENKYVFSCCKTDSDGQKVALVYTMDKETKELNCVFYSAPDDRIQVVTTAVAGIDGNVLITCYPISGKTEYNMINIGTTE